MRSLVFPFAFVFAVAMSVVVFAVWRRRRAMSQEHEEARREAERAAIQDAIDKRILLPDGRPACIVCKREEATETWPVVRTSWLDRITLLRDLYALTPRYEVRDGQGDQYELLVCPADKRVAVQRWKEFLAAKRMQMQQTISQVEGEIAHLQSGGMLAGLQREHEESATRLREQGYVEPPSRRLLTATSTSSEDGPISMPPMTTKATNGVVGEDV